MNKTTLISLIFCFVGISSLSTSFAYADDENDIHASAHHHPSKWIIGISPRYYGLNSAGYAPAFLGGGLNAPKSGAVGLEFSIYHQTESAWQIGLGFGDVSYSNVIGTSSGEYDQSFFGFWLAKVIGLSDDLELSLGSLVGFGEARSEVLSATANGRTEESSFFVEPKIVIAQKITPWLKIGISGSYLEPMGQTQTIKGQSLTTGNISLHGASAGLEFIFGRFAE